MAWLGKNHGTIPFAGGEVPVSFILGILGVGPAYCAPATVRSPKMSSTSWLQKPFY